MEDEGNPTKALVPVTSEPTVDKSTLWKLVSSGSLKGLSAEQKLDYTVGLCKSLGIDIASGPFQIIEFDGKETLYATRACTEQLRSVHRISLKVVSEGWEDDGTGEGKQYRVRVEASMPGGRYDTACGVVSTKNKDGKVKGSVELANVPMKAETKAKRRATLSICGLGFLDEAGHLGTWAHRFHKQNLVRS